MYVLDTHTAPAVQWSRAGARWFLLGRCCNVVPQQVCTRVPAAPAANIMRALVIIITRLCWSGQLCCAGAPAEHPAALLLERRVGLHIDAIHTELCRGLGMSVRSGADDNELWGFWGAVCLPCCFAKLATIASCVAYNCCRCI